MALTRIQARDPLVWFLDHTFHDDMLYMCKKINARERVVGWYAIGSAFKSADLDIHEIFRRYTPNPVHLLVNARGTAGSEFPVSAYISVEEANSVQQFTRTFVHVPIHYAATEAEAVGVEHLQRDMLDRQSSTMGADVVSFVKCLGLFSQRLEKIEAYLKSVQEGELEVNQTILAAIQESFSTLPPFDERVVGQLSSQTQDAFVSFYTAAMVRTVLAAHTLVDGKAAALKKRVDVATES